MHTRPMSRQHSMSRRGLGSVVAAVATSAVLLLTGCTAADPTPSAQSGAPPLAEHDLKGLDARQVIERLDTMPIANRPDDLIASVWPDELVLTDGQDESILPMSEDEFYLSVAPFSEQTHECFFHSLTTCMGELADAEVQVTVKNTATGEVLINDVLTTYDNGFVGLWLPRDIDATLTVTADGRSGMHAISTRADDPTCLTTLQLS